MTHIVKRRGHLQEFDERKIYGSVYAACLASHTDEEMAEATANLVVKEIKKWIENRDQVTSREIFEKISDELEHLNKDAAFMYKTHRDLS
jgi:transcriptional regulator NrdR family protein